MLAPRLRGIHMGHEFLGSRIEGLVLESFLHECGEPARVLVLASRDFFLLSVSPHKWVRHSGRTRWLRPNRDGTTAKEEVVAAGQRSSRRSPRSPSRSSLSSSPAPTSSSTAARWSLSAGRASGCAAPARWQRSVSVGRHHKSHNSKRSVSTAHPSKTSKAIPRNCPEDSVALWFSV